MIFGLNFFPVVEPEDKSAVLYFDEALLLTELAEALNFEHVQTVEHYFTPYGGYSPEPALFLAAAAARTNTIRLTTGAIIPAFAHPLKIAGKLAMLDNISHGRVDAGFGRAFIPSEFDAFQVSIDESRARFDEALLACRRLWTEEDVVWDGEFYQFGPVTMLPRPVQAGGLPIFVASAKDPESCAAAGRAGYHLQVVPTITTREGLQQMIGGYRDAWREAGHDPADARIQVKYTCYIADDHAHALELGEKLELNYIDKMTTAIAAWKHVRSDQYKGYEKLVEKVKQYDFAQSLKDNKVLAGDPGAVLDQLRQIEDWFGSDITISLQFNSGYMRYADSVRAMELFAERIMPELQDMP